MLFLATLRSDTWDKAAPRLLAGVEWQLFLALQGNYGPDMATFVECHSWGSFWWKSGCIWRALIIPVMWRSSRLSAAWREFRPCWPQPWLPKKRPSPWTMCLWSPWPSSEGKEGLKTVLGRPMAKHNPAEMLSEMLRRSRNMFEGPALAANWGISSVVSGSALPNTSAPPCT